NKRDLCLLGWRTRIAQWRARKISREECGAVRVDTPMRQRRADGDEPRQVVVFRAKAVRDPRAHARADERVAACMQFQERTAVAGVGAVHRMDEAQIVDSLGQVREDFADPGAAVTMLTELEW